MREWEASGNLRNKRELWRLEKDHYTFAEDPHGFRKAWPLKKALANREYRRKADELLSHTKTGASSEEIDLVAGELTSAHVRNSVSRKHLRKSGTVSAGEKIRITLKKRTAAGRRAKKRRKYDMIVRSGVETLNSLEEEALVDAVRRIAVLLQGGYSVEWARLYQSTDRLDRAIFFVERIVRGDGDFHDALRRGSGTLRILSALEKEGERNSCEVVPPAAKKN